MAAFFVLSLFSFGDFFVRPLFAATIYDEYGNPIRVVNTPKGSLPSETQEKSEEKTTSETALPASGEKKTSAKKSRASGEDSKQRVFTRSTIEKTNANSVGDFLRQKGFLVMSSGGDGSKQELSFKGFTAFCIKVYVDGIYANNPATGEFDWNSIDLDSIESIEVSESPKLGNSEFAGCVVYITTKKGDAGDDETAGAKSADTGRLSTHTAFSSYETKFFDSAYQSVRYTDSVDSFKYDIFGSLAYYDNFYKKGNKGLVNAFNAAKDANVNFNWSAVINKNISMTGSDIFSYNNLKVQNSGQTLTSGIETDYMTQNAVNLDLKYDKIEFMTNLSYFYGQVDYLEKYDIIDYKDSDITKTNTQVVSLAETMTYEWIDAFLGYKESHAFYANADRHEISFGVGKKYEIDWFSVEPIVNFLVYGVSDSESETTARQTSWHFDYLPSLTLGLGDFFVSGYRLVTLPTFNQLYWPDTSYARGNPDLKPETGWAASVGYKSMTFPLFVRFTYCYYENKIRWGSDENGVLMPLNTTNADFYTGTIGYEQEVWKKKSGDEGYNGKNASLVLVADFTVNEARLRETCKQIMWVPEYQAHAAVNFNFGGFEFSTDYAFTSKRYTSNDNVTSYPALHLWNASVGYDFASGKKGKVLLYAKVTNLLDQKIEYHDGYYIPSRKWTLGMKFKGSFYK